MTTFSISLVPNTLEDIWGRRPMSRVFLISQVLFRHCGKAKTTEGRKTGKGRPDNSNAHMFYTPICGSPTFRSFVFFLFALSVCSWREGGPASSTTKFDQWAVVIQGPRGLGWPFTLRGGCGVELRKLPQWFYRLRWLAILFEEIWHLPGGIKCEFGDGNRGAEEERKHVRNQNRS